MNFELIYFLFCFGYGLSYQKYGKNILTKIIAVIGVSAFCPLILAIDISNKLNENE